MRRCALLLALSVVACRTSQRASERPPAPAPAAAAEHAVPASAEPAPAAARAPSPAPVDCSSAAIGDVLDGRTRWTNEGSTCLDQLAKACRAGNGDACIDAGTILANGMGGVTKDAAAALKLETDACAADVARACLVAGVMLEQGIGAASDGDAGRLKIARACELRDPDACRIVERAAAARVPDELVPDANLRVGSIAADGLELRDLACAVSGGPPMLGALVVVASLAKQRRAIDKCAPKGQAFAVTWTFANAKVKSPVATGGSASANACVAKAFARAVAPFEARCGAFVLAGKPDAAATTLEAARASRSAR